MKIDEELLREITEREKRAYIETVDKNPYMLYKPYKRQSIPIWYCLRREKDKEVHSILAGGSGYGGKTFLGSMLAVQYLHLKESYTCLVTRRNYAELLDTNSIWENVVDWACDPSLPDDVRCTSVKSPSPKITAPNGNTIYFKAFDRDTSKQKFKSASYDRIINDEASELPREILPFQYRSMRNTSHIPRSIINLSNPGGESTKYLIEQFVDGQKPYLSLGWQDNQHIDREAYYNSLKELDYIDYQYQAVGDWHYTVSVGDLISDKQIDEAVVTGLDNYYFYLLSVDLASTGQDLTVVSLLGYQDGIIYLLDTMSTEEAIADKLIVQACLKYKDICHDIVIEQEAGSTPVYFKHYISEKIGEQGLTTRVYLQRVNRSKYQRARPLASALINRKCFISKDFTNYDQFKYELSNMNPLGDGESPNYVDSVTLGFNWLDNKRLNKNKMTIVRIKK